MSLMTPEPIKVVTLCTGNVARSVMAGVMLTQLAEHEGIDLVVVTAGTLVVEGQPVSRRTLSAMESIGELDTSAITRHRSHQLADSDARPADLIVAMEADHVRYVRRNHSSAAHKTATIQRLVTQLTVDDQPIVERLRAMELASTDLDEDVDVADPAGGQQPEYDACATELWEFCQALIVLLG